jgi:putative transposase
MPVRPIEISTDEYYHIYNRGLLDLPIYTNSDERQRFCNLLHYYRFKNIIHSYSNFIRFGQDTREKLLKNLEKNGKRQVKIVAFCLMPNHYHLLLKQTMKNGIENFISRVQNGYAKFFNIIHKRKGQLFDSRFGAVLVYDDMQLLHLSRYIHLNPYSSHVVKSTKQLLDYDWSSLPQYLGKEKGFCEPAIVLGQFKKPEDYQKFVLDQAGYQRELQQIKKLIID